MTNGDCFRTAGTTSPTDPNWPWHKQSHSPSRQDFRPCLLQDAVLRAEMGHSGLCSILGPGLAARKSVLRAPRAFYEAHQHGGSCVIPGMLQEEREKHYVGLAVRLLWSYTEMILPLTATWSFIQKPRDWTRLCPLKLNAVQNCGGSSREKGPTRDRGCI